MRLIALTIPKSTVTFTMLIKFCDYIYNMFKICLIVVTILSNRFETDFERDQVMKMEAMLKICFKMCAIKVLMLNMF